VKILRSVLAFKLRRTKKNWSNFFGPMCCKIAAYGAKLRLN
jgi:hypothetical protein